MARRMLRSGLLICLACWSTTIFAGAPPVVRSEAQLQAVLASGQPTPLDALTPYGKRSFLRSLSWGSRGLGGFGTREMLRELDAGQIDALAAFIDSSAYSPARGRDLSSPPLRLPEPAREIEERFVQLEQSRREDAASRRDAGARSAVAVTSALEGRYLTLFGEHMKAAILRKRPVGDLPLLFDAATLASGDGRFALAAGHQRLVYQEMQRRGLDTRRGFDEVVLDGLLSAREFAQARSFAAARPHLRRWTIPAVHDPLGPGFTGRSVYRYDAATQMLVREALPHPRGIELVMVVDAGCHFSADALAALQKDADLRARLLEANLRLVTPPRSPIAYRFVEEWNAANPAIPMRIPHHAREWQAIDVAGVPEFYVFKDGKLVAELRSGWPAEGNKAALLAMLDAAKR